MNVDEIELTENYGKKKLDTDFSGFNGFMKLMQMIMGDEPSPTSGKNQEDRRDLCRRRDRRRPREAPACFRAKRSAATR